MNTVPNQRVVQVNKALCNKNNLYTTNNLEAMESALFNIKSIGAYKLYIYMAINQHSYAFALSRVDFCNKTGLSASSYHKGFKELEELGYLVRQGTSNIYTFNDLQELEYEELENVIIVPSIAETDTFIY